MTHTFIASRTGIPPYDLPLTIPKGDLVEIVKVGVRRAVLVRWKGKLVLTRLLYLRKAGVEAK